MNNARTLLATLAALPLLLAVAACDDPKPKPPAAAETAAAPATQAPSPAAETAKAAAPHDPPAPPATFDVDQSHSRLVFSVRHLMVSNTRGQFEKFGGTVFLDEANPAASTVKLEIDTASINSADAKRDEHLRSADFFDVKKHPKMTFTSTKVERAGAGYRITGDLTIRDVTKPVVLDVDPVSPSVKDPWGGTRRGTRARAKLDRKEFGLTWNKALEAGGVAVGDEVTLDLEVELIQKKPS
ncbi:MAG: YceI family protein [Deltaproteobacteria bacterium]|nr:YceI family protein [Deltaproteobacteria bacterium]